MSSPLIRRDWLERCVRECQVLAGRLAFCEIQDSAAADTFRHGMPPAKTPLESLILDGLLSRFPPKGATFGPALRESRPPAPSDRGAAVPGYAARRLAEGIVAVIRSKEDVPTLAAWSKKWGWSDRTVKAWCATCQVAPKRTLSFARAARVVTLFSGQSCDWFSTLSIRDARTMRRFLSQAALIGVDALPSFDQFVRDQRFIVSSVLLDAVHSLSHT